MRRYAMPETSSELPSLKVHFPKRMARFGVVFFSFFLALFTGWVRSAEQMPWLAVVAGTGCFLAMMMSLRQLMWPKVLAEADTEGVTIHTRKLKERSVRFLWRDIREMSYEERQVGQWIHKVIRLHMDQPVDQALREIKDEDHIAHLDAFAAEPGGEELLEKLRALRGTG